MIQNRPAISFNAKAQKTQTARPALCLYTAQASGGSLLQVTWPDSEDTSGVRVIHPV